MTTTVNEIGSVSGYRCDTSAMMFDFLKYGQEDGELVSADYSSVEIKSISARHVRKSCVSRKVLRRLHGFLVEIGSAEAKVMFVDGNSTFEYFLPSFQLKEAKITAENQPFEMDEVESKSGDETMFGYVFRPVALPKDAFAGSITLDGEREKKRSLIFKAFGHAQD